MSELSELKNSVKEFQLKDIPLIGVIVKNANQSKNTTGKGVVLQNPVRVDKEGEVVVITVFENGVQTSDNFGNLDFLSFETHEFGFGFLADIFETLEREIADGNIELEYLDSEF